MRPLFLLCKTLLVLLPFSACFIPASYRLETAETERYEVVTEDGWVLPLYYYPAQGVTKPKASVILCHGLSVNRFDLDFDEKNSLARYLAREGYEAWVMERRGAGNSHRMGGAKKPYDWNFDDYVVKDLPAILKFVRQQAKTSDLVWLGHSAGGMVMYAYLTTHEVEPPFRLVSIASPGEFQYLHDFFQRNPLLQKVAWRSVNGPLKTLPLRTLARTFYPWLMVSPHDQWLWHVLFNPENLDERDFWQLHANSWEDLPVLEWRQWYDWATSGDFRAADRKFSYRDHLSKMDVPALFIAGSVDNLVSTEAVLYAYEQASSTEKTFREFGRWNGDRDDYGHIDLILGREAPYEVFPFIVSWLNQTDF
ncbi:MAG: alpha/beta fold hydrolase [Deltaproteobacteria bacterium]|nr:alpha/beta fold hydrolase [Deltaproteobacteria bacterium]